MARVPDSDGDDGETLSQFRRLARELRANAVALANPRDRRLALFLARAFERRGERIASPPGSAVAVPKG